MTNPMMTVNPLLMALGQQRIPLIPSPFGPPFVDRDALPSVAPTNPRNFCVPSHFGSSVLPNANMPNMLPNHGYSGWGILPSESIKAVTRRNEMIHRHHTARSELEMYAVYQQRRMEKVTTEGLTGLGVPFLHSSSFPAGPATYHGRSKHFHRSALWHLQENPVLLATRPHVLQRWGQKYQPKRSTRNQKPLDSGIESSKRQAEEKTLGQMPAIPCEEDDYAKHPKFEVCHNQESSETKEKLTPRIKRAVLQSSHKKPCRGHTTPLEAKPWDYGKEKAAERESEDCGGENGVCSSVPPLRLPGTHALLPPEESLPLDADIQKWTVDDVHDFIRSLPGCSDYARTFKDHAIDGEILPLLTEEHLQGTMGLKLGPGLKIQSQVSQHVRSMFYKKTLSLPTHARQALDQPADTCPLLGFNSWSNTLSIPCSQD